MKTTTTETDIRLSLQRELLREIDAGRDGDDFNEATWTGPDGERIETHRAPHLDALMIFEAYNADGILCARINWTGGPGNVPVQCAELGRYLIDMMEIIFSD